MARPLRIEYQDAWYHVMNRGAGRCNIFLNNEDRRIFLELLEDISVRFQVEIHAYCLMDELEFIKMGEYFFSVVKAEGIAQLCYSVDAILDKENQLWL